MNFDPNALASNDSNIFGLPYTSEESDLIIIPATWDVTVSYGNGTAKGPDAILKASKQVDLFLRDIPQAWNSKMFLLPNSQNWKKRSKKLRKLAEKYLDALANNTLTEANYGMLEVINEGCKQFHHEVYELSKSYLNQNKLLGLLGGDHSVSLGLIQALSEKFTSFSVLQIDAHCDLRNAYEGFKWSHASISYNFLKIKQVNKLVQVGIRDLCDEEYQFIQQNQNQICVFYDEDLQEAKANGIAWNKLEEDIINQLDNLVYLSFDIDGLSPDLCPNTGTPVPGGLSFYEATSLIKKLTEAGKTIIGFDLVEVSPGENEWDANVGARMLFRIAQECIKSQKNSKNLSPAKVKSIRKRKA
jgi:agmatinase